MSAHKLLRGLLVGSLALSGVACTGDMDEL